MSLTNDAENFDKNPMKIAIKWGAMIIVTIFILGVLSGVLGVFTGAAKVAKQEFGAEAALTKYEWFIDASANIEKMRTDIDLYEENVKTFSGSNVKLSRAESEQLMTWRSELVGVKSGYNGLVAEYNAQSKKFNWDMFKSDHAVSVPELYQPR